MGAKQQNTCAQCLHVPTELPFCIPPLVVGFNLFFWRRGFFFHSHQELIKKKTTEFCTRVPPNGSFILLPLLWKLVGWGGVGWGE